MVTHVQVELALLSACTQPTNQDAELHAYKDDLGCDRAPDSCR
jgi:hypothetical protein